MNSKIGNILMFATGAAIGSLVTWKLLKTKYERIAQEEIDSVKEVFSRRNNPNKEKQKKNDIDVVSSQLNDYTKKLNETGYINKKEEGGDNMTVKPYVISPDEFDEVDGYDAVSLTYYADNILTDDLNNIVTDVDNIVGLDSLTHFGEYEDDSVFVRNDVLKTDYEILLDVRNYSDIENKTPLLVEDDAV